MTRWCFLLIKRIFKNMVGWRTLPTYISKRKKKYYVGMHLVHLIYSILSQYYLVK